MKYFLLFLIFSSTIAQAQFGRPPQRGERGYSPPPRNIEPAAKERPDNRLLSQERATLYANEIGLDAFEKEVLKQYLKEYYEAKTYIEFDQEVPYEDRKPFFDKEEEKLKQNLKGFLNEEQINQILTFEDVTIKKLDKRKKKKKKNKDKKSQN